MRKIVTMAATACMLVGCQSVDLGQYADVVDDEEESAEGGGVVKTKKFTFTVKTTFDVVPMTDEVAVDLDQLSMNFPLSKATSYLSSNTQSMADLWVLDYMDGSLVQMVHQVPTDEVWGVPTMSLAYGEHHVYFVASRGVEPVLDTEAGTITWGSVRDTFWKDYEVSVVSTSNGNRAVTLDRVVSKFRAIITDDIPSALAYVTLVPSVWYTTYDYITGEPVNGGEWNTTVSVPASYIGTTGQLAVSVFSLSPAADWSTDIAVTATNISGDVLGQVSLDGVPLKRNRATEFSGQLFRSGGAVTISMNDDWLESYIGNW